MSNKITLSTRSEKITQHFFVNAHSVTVKADKPSKTVKTAVDHVFCCDISGSMWDELPLMRRQLKNRLSDLVKDDDTITIIAFAGRNRCVTLKEFVKCSTPEQLQQLHAAIDRFLTPGGCTDFVNPIRETAKLVSKATHGLNWIFLSDGGHNESPFADVIQALQEIKNHIKGATIIEYGYYADSKALSQMASELGGAKVTAEKFESYEPKFEAAIRGAGSSVSIVEVDIPTTVTANVSPTVPKVFFVNPATKLINVSFANNGKVSLPEGVKTFYSFTNSDITDTKTKKTKKGEDKSFLYAAAYILADMLKYDWTEKVLAAIGDKKFIELYANSFGKQKLFIFQDELLKAVFDESLRGEIDPKYKPSPANYCIVDLFNDLQKTKGNLVKVLELASSYKRIGSKSVAKSEALSAEDQAKLANAKTASELKEVLDKKEETNVKMTMIDKGYPVDNFVWNETRANLNARIKIDVELELPKNNFGKTKMNSTVYRNYNIVKDGLVNTNILPLELTEETLKEISRHKAVVLGEQTKESNGLIRVDVDISKLPVININRARGVKKATMTKMEYDLLELKFKLKYLGWLKKGLDSSLTTKNKWEDNEETQWLASLGITSEGFNPPSTVQKNEDDFYLSLNFDSKFAKFSSVPKIEDALDAKKKPTPSIVLLRKIIEIIDKELAKCKTDDAKSKKIIEMFDNLTKEKRELGTKIAQTKFAMIVARRWFNDCESFDDNTDKISNAAGEEMTVTFGFSEAKEYL